MIHGLGHDTISLLRQRFPRLLIPELISRIAAFERDCWAGSAYLAEQIGRSVRTVFRYFAILRDEGVLKRVWGSRELEAMPEGAQHPGKLRKQGYKLTGFTGWLGPLVSDGIQRRREGMTEAERRQAARERKREQHRQRRAENERKRREHEKKRLEDQFPELAARASKPRPERPERPAPPVGPRYAATAVGATYDVEAPLGRDTGPPD